jgi:hypothetical protein
MIGNAYWATGITVDFHDGRWSATAEFFDDGFAGDNNTDAGRVSTEGKIGTRYSVTDGEHADALMTVIDVIKADVEKLGIEWRSTSGIGPYIYAEFETATEHYPERYPEDWRHLLTEQAHRVGWDALYLRAEQRSR